MLRRGAKRQHSKQNNQPPLLMCIVIEYVADKYRFNDLPNQLTISIGVIETNEASCATIEGKDGADIFMKMPIEYT